MQEFNYKKTAKPEEAWGVFANPKVAKKIKFLAGGTTLIDLMKLDVETPQTVIDINQLPFQNIDKTSDGVFIGAMVKNAELANNELIKKEFPLLSQALLSGASPQLRNKATTSGNLLQRTRCVYFRDTASPCNKRVPNSGCPAMEGMNRNLAILGTSDKCIASNPSDMNVALMALEAQIHVAKPGEERKIPIGSFYLLPQNNPEKETVLEANDLITGVSLSALPKNTKTFYLKLRDRASYEFATSSAAIVLTMEGGKIGRVRMAMGGVGTRPWRSENAEKILEGQAPSEDLFKKAAKEFISGAKPRSQNEFKVELAQRCLVYALQKTVNG